MCAMYLCGFFNATPYPPRIKIRKMNMGYGFLRATYGQKAKRPYAYLKNLYGEQLEKHLPRLPMSFKASPYPPYAPPNC